MEGESPALNENFKAITDVGLSAKHTQGRKDTQNWKTLTSLLFRPTFEPLLLHQI